MSASASFKNAKACFAENIERLPQPNPPLKNLEKADALMWNLNRGLLDLTTALETRLKELEAKIAHLEAQ
jgi:hypothetical protein